MDTNGHESIRPVRVHSCSFAVRKFFAKLREVQSQKLKDLKENRYNRGRLENLFPLECRVRSAAAKCKRPESGVGLGVPFSEILASVDKIYRPLVKTGPANTPCRPIFYFV